MRRFVSLILSGILILGLWPLFVRAEELPSDAEASPEPPSTEEAQEPSVEEEKQKDAPEQFSLKRLNPSGTCGLNLDWSLDISTGRLSITGAGAMDDFQYLDNGSEWGTTTAPWAAYSLDIVAVELSSGVSSIGNHAFWGCFNLSSVSLPSSLLSIGDSAFTGNNKLTAITVPGRVSSIGIAAFSYCSALTAISVSSANTSYLSEEGAVYTKDGKTLIAFPGGLGGTRSLPNGVTAIERCALRGSSVSQVHLPNGFLSIGADAFYDCSKLGEIVLPESLTGIGSCAFAKCPALSSVTFRGNAPTIGALAFQNDTLTAYCLKDDDSWTLAVMNDYGGHITWVASAPPGAVYEGSCGEGLTWKLDFSTGTLVVSGAGRMEDYGKTDAPWYFHRDGIKLVIVEEGVTAISAYAFADCSLLTELQLPTTLTALPIGSLEGCNSFTDGVYYCGGDLRWFAMAEALPEDDELHVAKSSLHKIQIHAHKNATCLEPGHNEWTDCALCGRILVTKTEEQALGHSFTEAVGKEPGCTETGVLIKTCRRCEAVEEETIPAKGHNEEIDGAVAPSCTQPGLTEGKHCSVCETILLPQQELAALGHSWEVLTVLEAPSYTKTGLAEYGCTLCGETKTDELSKLSGIRVAIEAAESECIFLNGSFYSVDTQDGACYICLPENIPSGFAVGYTHHIGDGIDPHTQYPTAIQVWFIEAGEEGYTTRRIEALDNCLQYAGSSIRITGNKGIRMITSIPKDIKNKLTREGIDGFTLEEYGTLVAWVSEMNGEELLMDRSFSKTAFAYKKGTADPIYKDTGKLIQYTNVLVGFSLEQCVPDLAMRPYMILSDAAGEQYILYGGSIQRSIGYIAYQNRAAFKSGTSQYSYIWDIIHHVYGDVFDSEQGN